MTSLERTAEALRQRGFTVSVFETAEAAADYLDGAIDGRTVGFGGSMTLEAMDLWERLRTHNQVYSHLHGFPRGHQYRRYRQPGGLHPVRTRKGVSGGGPQ